MDRPSLDLLEHLAPKLGFNPILDGIQVAMSWEFVWAEEQTPFEAGLLAFTPLRPLLVDCAWLDGDLPNSNDPWIDVHAPALVRYLTRFLGSDEATVTCIGPTKAEDRRVGEIANGYRPAFVYVTPGDEFTNGASDPRAMHRIVARLRRPDGCPWDRKQTNATLRNSLVNEVYEAVDAIDRGDMDHLAEELGDLFLLILMHAQIAHEAHAFSIEDVYRGIATKIVGRHPHVFGDMSAGEADDVLGIWAEAKAKEKAGKGNSGGKDVDGEPFSMPALTRATRVLAKHPLDPAADAPPLLRAVAEIVARGEDPDELLRHQLREHLREHGETESPL